MIARAGGSASWGPRETPAPGPPRWVVDALGPAPRAERLTGPGGLVAEIAEGGNVSLIRVALGGAAALADEDFEQGAAALYAWLGVLTQERGESPLRFWNFVPDIGRSARAGFRRYEVFNAGRYRGIRSAWRCSGSGPQLAAASAIGADNPDLVTLLLTAKQPGTAVESPRQLPAFLYSRRYGEIPPFFCRATRLSEPIWTEAGCIAALVSGTASIVGEDSQHPGDLSGQIEETLRNLAAIAAAVRGGPVPAPERALNRWLSRYRHVRVYGPPGVAMEQVVARVRSGLSRRARIEWTTAALCRPELLVEVEGTLAAPEAESRG